MKRKSEETERKKIVEDFAMNFASNKPKQTNFNNMKTRKYFGNKNINDNDSNSNTLIDSLVGNQIFNSVSTNIKTDSMNSSI